MPAEVTLVVPCCNGAPYLEPLLTSLLAQDPAPARILMVDDASTDGSVELARRIMGADFEVIRHGERRGLAATWNHGAELVGTGFFAITHQDDVYEPGFTRRLSEALEGQPDAGVAHCLARTMDGGGELVDSPAEKYKRPLWQAAADAGGGREVFALLLEGNFVICPSVMYRTEAFRDIGGFTSGLRFVPDWDFVLRLLLGGWSVAALAEHLIRYRRHGTNASVDEVRSLNRYREELELLRAMRNEGVDRGWLDGGRPLGSALRRNILYDAFCDVRAGEADQARLKLGFLDEHVPEQARHRSVRWFRRALAMGGPGTAALRVGLWSVMVSARLRR